MISTKTPDRSRPEFLVPGAKVVIYEAFVEGKLEAPKRIDGRDGAGTPWLSLNHRSNDAQTISLATWPKWMDPSDVLSECLVGH